MTIETVAWDSENECFYYINHVKEMYTKITKKYDKEVYDFLYYTYAVNWNVVEKQILTYKYVGSISEISNY